jgi:outer membrane protein, heavy metal efflux system
MRAKRLCVILGLATLPLAGCLSAVRQESDALICHRAGLAMDALPPPWFAASPEPTPTEKAAELLPPPKKGAVQTMAERLTVPPTVPGGKAPLIELPKDFRTLKAEEQDKILAKYFPVQLSMGPDPRPVPGPEDRPLTLADLQRLARESSPLLRQAAFDIKAAEGAAVQAGLYPNPTIGTSTTTLGPSGGPTMGAVISQLIKTGGKLKLAEAAAAMDLANAQLAYRRAETDLMAAVRADYFAVLAAQEGMRANRALADLTDELYKVMQLQMKGGQFATYEPMSVGVVAAQARAALIVSRNSYLLAWKQLAAAMGLSAMPATELAGRIDQNLPRFDYEKALAHVLANHTDVLTAHYTIQKARYNLRLAQVTPIPDVTVSATSQYDATPPGPPRIFTTLTATVPVPLFDRNQGGIQQAQGQLLRAVEEPHRVRADLTVRISDAFRRLEENRLLLELYRRQILPQAVQAFRAAVNRHYIGPAQDVAYTDVITAEQTIVSVAGTYLTTLQNYWQAVSDVGSLLQTDDIFLMATQVENCPLPDLGKLLALPCCHPCSSLPSPTLKGISSFESPPGQPVAPDPAGTSSVPGPQSPPPAATAAPAVLAPPALGLPVGRDQ